MDCCFDLFYGMVWSCFDRHVPMRFSRGGQKSPWITSELSSLKNKKTKAAKRSMASEKRCLEDEKIDDCECKQLEISFTQRRVSANTWSGIYRIILSIQQWFELNAFWILFSHSDFFFDFGC
jgi:hypothetical protein